MIPCLEKVDSLLADAVDQAVFLRDSPRPAAGENELQGFWFANSGKRVSHDIFHEFKDSYRYFPVCLDPISQVLPELRMEERFAFSGTRQGPTPDATCRPIPA